MNKVLKDKKVDKDEEEWDRVFFEVDEELPKFIDKIITPHQGLWAYDNQRLIDKFFDIRNQLVDLIIELEIESVDNKNE